MAAFLPSFRQLVPEEVGPQRVRVPAAFRFGADGRRGTEEAPKPLLRVPDRAASAGQGPAVLPAAVLPAVHRPDAGRPEAQRAAAGHSAAGQVSLRPESDPGADPLAPFGALPFGYHLLEMFVSAAAVVTLLSVLTRPPGRSRCTSTRRRCLPAMRRKEPN